MDLKKFIRSIPDYPKKGILFRDITTLIKDEKAFEEAINQIVERSKKFRFNKIAAIESRGFASVSSSSSRNSTSIIRGAFPTSGRLWSLSFEPI